MKKFHSIEYLDEEGETVVTHAFLTEIQVHKLMEEFANRGVIVHVNDLTPCQVLNEVPNSVLFGDEQILPRLGEPS